MSKHWNPNQNARVRSPGRGRPSGPRRHRPTSQPWFSGGEIRLTILFGILLGLGATQIQITSIPALEGHAEIDRPAAASAEVRRAVDIIDGDTFRADGETIRIADIDTPEMRGRCAYESALARRATARLEALLTAGPFELAPAEDGRDEDRYGRKLRIVMRGGESLGGQLVDEGLARPWTGRRMPWCA
jgi:endonuclease YncB( thermonuclease family)